MKTTLILTSALGFLLTSLVGCDATTLKKPDVVLSSPDNTVKTMWALARWQEERYGVPALEDQSGLVVLASEARAERDKHRKKAIENNRRLPDQTIEKVEVESETRAVVLARERGPWDKEVVVNRYVLARQGREWLVEDHQLKCWRCDGTGSARDHEASLENIKRGFYGEAPTIQCPKCQGSGWASQIFDHGEEEE